MPRKHVVAEGEYLTLIARRHGFSTSTALLAANAELFAERRDPNILNPGDEIVIPDKKRKLADRPTGQIHEFRLGGSQDRLRLALRDAEDRPLADQPFTLRVQAALDAPVDSGLPVTGRTGGDGSVDVALPPGAVRAYLVLDQLPFFSWELQVGALDPTHDPVDGKTIVSGVQARLNNLGYRAGAVDGVLGPRTKAAIARFQRRRMQRAEASGELDDATRDAIRGAYGT
jgi:hypothetical protein